MKPMYKPTFIVTSINTYFGHLNNKGRQLEVTAIIYYIYTYIYLYRTIRQFCFDGLFEFKVI